MELYTVDAFTDVEFGGNPAGVAIFEDALPSEDDMRAIAKQVGYSETAFVLPLGKGEYKIRYFTPVEEVALCGHATVATFSLLAQSGRIREGERCTVHVGAGDISVDVSSGLVWLDMAEPRELARMTKEEAAELLAMYSLPADACGDLLPAIVDSGLPDIMLPIRSTELLSSMVQDEAAVTGLSRRLNVTGVHAFTLCEGDVRARCRNFAPLYGIIEEAATGTSNGALTYYLYARGLVEDGGTNLFIQGEAMGKPSKIYSRLTVNDGKAAIRVGGSGVVRK